MTRILVTNDDGVQAEGIRELARALSELPDAEVVVVAPDREQSASGHSLTLHRPLRLREMEAGWYAVDGTPTDAVNLAIHWLLRERPPDLVVSGINRGLNLGADVTYSGTVSATFEACLLGLPSVAFSLEDGEEASFPRAAEFARRFVATLLAAPLEPRMLLNVNLPARPVNGVALARLGRRVYRQVVVEKEDPRGRRYFWIAGTPEWSDDEGTDHHALIHGLASVTPLHLDLTDYRALDRLGELTDRLRQLFGS